MVIEQAYAGQIRMFSGDDAPRGWAFCEGQLLPIDRNPVLFSLLGTTYGGDGRNTFALPDLRGRVPIPLSRGSQRVGDSGAAQGGDAQTAPTPTANFIICLGGAYPNRD